MTIRAPVRDLADGERVLPAEESRYLARVLRLGAGDRFVAFDPDARTEADCVIMDGSPGGVRVKIDGTHPAQVTAKTRLALVYALAKGDKVDAVVRDATELGATDVILAQSARSVVKLKNPGDRAATKLYRWRRIAEQAARQCGRADPPAIDGVYDWSSALDRAADCDARFCLDPRAERGLGAALGPFVARAASIAFAIGPEGGLSPEEVDVAAGKGFLPASLGPFVLRTETVAAAVLGAVRVLTST